MNQCKQCGSFAFNLKGIDQGNLCDVCYWRTKAEQLEQELHLLKCRVAFLEDLISKYESDE